MQRDKKKFAELIQNQNQKQQVRLNSTPFVNQNESSLKNLSGQRVQTEQSRRIKTLQSQRFKLYYKSESREPIKFQNYSKMSSSDSRKQSNSDSHVNTSTSDNEDKALMIHKIVFSIKSPIQSLRFQSFILDKKPQNCNLNKRKTLRNSLLTNLYQKKNILTIGNECGWSRKSSESFIFLC